MDFPILQKVNVFQGTGGHGHTHPAATAPFGLVQAGPDTRREGWDGCSGYHYDDQEILGFSQTHLSGTGVADLNDFLIQPHAGKPSRKFTSYPFSHENESARPGYYSVNLKKSGFSLAVVATTRGACYQIAYHKKVNPYITLDLTYRDQTLESAFRQLNDSMIVVKRVSSSWAARQYAFAIFTFSQKIYKLQVVKNGNDQPEKLYIQFRKSNLLHIKMGYSGSSEQGAMLNYESELKPFCFEQLVHKSDQQWEKELNVLRVFGNEKYQKTFYSCLYHCFILPSVWSDVDGKFRIGDSVYQDSSYTHYTLFSLWDTYRALHPLLTVTHPQRTRDFLHTFLSIYKHRKELPVWELHGNETHCMIGVHSMSVIADAYSKGIGTGLGMELMDAMSAQSFLNGQGRGINIRQPFLTADLGQESVSKSMENSYDAWCVSKMAEAVFGNGPVSQYYLRLGAGYRSLFNPHTGFMQAKRNGKFIEPFDPVEVNHHFTEANSWQYSFHVMHDLPAFVQMKGGFGKMITSLDALFSQAPILKGRQQPDITGLIGQYAHGNEPSHHIPYIYHALGQPQKGNKIVFEIMDSMYGVVPEGLPGNEDCGQMSAWYIWSSIGLYPHCPGTPNYTFSRPLFDSIQWKMSDGKVLKILRKGDAQGWGFRSISWDQFYFSSPYFPHKALSKGGTLIFDMTGDPKEFRHSVDFPEIEVPLENSLAPTLRYNSHVFRDSVLIYIDNVFDGSENYFFKMGQGPWTYHPSKFRAIVLYQSDTLTVRGQNSKLETQALFVKQNPEWKISLSHSPHPEYTGGGPEALWDGLWGNPDFHGPGWQSYHGDNFEAVIEFEKQTQVYEFSAHCLQNTDSWIWFPEGITIASSLDGVNYELLKSEKWAANGNGQKWFTIDLSGKTTRFLKIKVVNRGVCPNGFPGQGEKAHLFIDEIRIK